MSLIRDFIDGRYKNEDEGEVGIGGFTTFARIRDNVKRTQEVPVTYLEDGSHVNDHIIRNPIVLSIEGDVSNVHVNPSPTLKDIRNTETIVGEVAQYLPGRTKAQLSIVAGITADVQQQIDRVDYAVRTGQRVADTVGYQGQTAGEFIQNNLGIEGFAPEERQTKTNIELFLDDMEGHLNSDSPIKISGPARTYENMVITSFDYTTDNTTESISFNLEAQEIRYAMVTNLATVANAAARSANGQHESESDKGAQEGREVEQSILDKYFGGAIRGAIGF